MIQNYIAGWKRSASGRTASRQNPCDVRKIVGQYQDSDNGDVNDAVAVAVGAFPAWAATNPIERGIVLEHAAGLLRDRREDIGGWLSEEEGKPLPEAIAEVQRAAEVFSFCAGFARHPTGLLLNSARSDGTISTMRRALGVVGVITPFNFPAFVPSLKLAPALMAGNCVVWKPSPDTPFTGAHIVQALVDAGLPLGVLSYVTGNAPELGEAIVEHKDVEAVSFTGSTPVGDHIEVEGARLGKRIQTEKGGVNTLVILSDANLQAAARAAVDGCFGGTGQKCTATRRVLVEQDSYDDVLKLMLQFTKTLVAGNGMEQGVQIGPLVNSNALTTVTQQLDSLVAAGGKVLIGGGRISSGELEFGHFFSPTIVSGVSKSSPVADQEVFGPVMVVEAVRNLDEALSTIGDSQFGLSAGIFSDSHSAITEFTNRVTAGLINVNLPTSGVEPQAPFGGLKKSGYGPKEVGQDPMAFYTHQVTVSTGKS